MFRMIKFTIVEVSLIVVLSVTAALARNPMLAISLAIVCWVGLMLSERHQQRQHRHHIPKSRTKR